MSDLDELSGLVRAFVAERDWEQYHSPKNLAAAVAVEADPKTAEEAPTPATHSTLD